MITLSPCSTLNVRKLFCLLYSLAGIDTKLLDELVTFLRTFVDATLALEAENTPTLHRVVPWFFKLKNHCIPSSDDSPQMIAIKTNAGGLLNVKYRIDPIHYVATVMNPRMKLLKVLDNKDDEKQAVYKTLQCMLTEMLNSEMNYAAAQGSLV